MQSTPNFPFRESFRKVLLRMRNPFGLVGGVDGWLMSQDPFDLVVHAGAHLCQEGRMYERQGTRTVVWIEANPSILPRTVDAAKHLKRANHVVIGATLDNTSGEPRNFFDFCNDGLSSSLYEPTPHLRELWPNLNVMSQLPAFETATLTEVLALAQIDLNDYERVLLTLDIQGNELRALQGLSSIQVSALSAVICEVTIGESIYAGGTDGDQLLDLLYSLGFEAVTALPETHGDVVFEPTLPTRPAAR